MKKKINLRTSIIVTIIISAAVVRIFNTLGHTPLSNFTPIGAMALFGGNHFSTKWKAYLFPLLTLWISDLFLSYFLYYHEWRWFYDGFYWTYGSFALMVLLGSMIKRVTVKNIVIACISASLIHWIISDFGVWMSGELYPKTIEGLIVCYTLAIPYMLYLFMGNLLFSGLTFGVFEYISCRYSSLKLSEIKY